jgi:hypothetical protein
MTRASDTMATKLTVGVVPAENAEVTDLHWLSPRRGHRLRRIYLSGLPVLGRAGTGKRLQ